MPLAEEVRTLIDRADERLFGRFDDLVGNGTNEAADIVRVLNDAGENDLAEKYENWLAEGDDE